MKKTSNFFTGLSIIILLCFSSLLSLYFIKFVYNFVYDVKEGYTGKREHSFYRHSGPARENRRRGDYERANVYYGAPRYRGGGWYNPMSWYGYFYGEPLYYDEIIEPRCKKGCTNLGNGQWGCQSLGRSWNNCWFASDCAAC